MAGTEMTDEQIDAMEAGPEIDAAIAKSILRGERFADLAIAVARGFAPSTDWNDAMFAAERFRLLDVGCGGCEHDLWQFSGEGLWIVSRNDDCRSISASAPTGPLAICRAILKLARDQSDCG